MGRSELIRESARKLRADVLSHIGQSDWNSVPCSRLVELTTSHLGIDLQSCPPGSALLRGAKAAQFGTTVIYDDSLSDGYKEYCILHEVGHFVLHHDSARTDCDSSDFGGGLIDDGLEYDAGFGYGPKMLREREANLFALEFLLPTDALHLPFLNQDQQDFLNIYGALKSCSGQSDSFLISQLSRAILLRPPDAVPSLEPKELQQAPPNPSQTRAAEVEKGPVLLVAGPGTGKTKTLIERIIFLLRQGADPNTILALTFSTKATEEIQERVEKFDREAARKISIYNFHGFALELLRKYWRETGLDQNPKVVSRLDAVLHLEKHYESFNFDALEDLGNPIQPFVDSLNFISRLQDELISHQDLEAIIADEERAISEDVDLQRNPDLFQTRLLEITKQKEALTVYRKYSDFLDESKSLDYGEMIFRCVRLLKENPKVLKDVRARFKNILVDEFQDVNRASGVLLKLIAGDGEGLWVVGDIRQSIYRWRGASPENIEGFHDEYAGASVFQLEENYRSAKDIVDLYSAFARTMKTAAGDVEVGWQSKSDMVAEISYKVFPDKESEHLSIAQTINDNISKGGAFSDHAVIARNKKALLELSKVLENERVPILYLGAVFEREEVRDLLCLLDVRASAEGAGLLRVAKLDEISIPEADVRIILSECNTEEKDFQKFIDSEAIPENLSPEGVAGLKRLRGILSRNPRTLSAYEFLGKVLFKEGLVLSSRLRNHDEIRTPQELLAIHQLLTLAGSVTESLKEHGELQIEKFLTHLKLLISLNEHHEFSRIPESLSKFDAVRIFTVHGSKGLEFESVFIPNLKNGGFPLTDRDKNGPPIPLPTPLREKTANYHEDEEECLFFVALSRAKRQLALSRTDKTADGKNVSESRFLQVLGDKVTAQHLPSARFREDAPYQGTGFEKTSMHFSWIEDYVKCPRKFYYKHVMEADSKQLISPYQRYHRCVNGTLGELKRRFRPEDLNSATALEVLEELFDKHQIDSHPAAKAYRRNATRVVEAFCKTVSQFPGEFYTKSLTCKVENGQVFFYPDLMIVSGSTARIFKVSMKARNASKKFKPEDAGEAIYLMAEAAKTELAVESVTTSLLFLPSMEIEDFVAKEDLIQRRKKKVETAIHNIREGRFEAKPIERNCKTCQYFLPCPS